jgi:hypothetical protein
MSFSGGRIVRVTQMSGERGVALVTALLVVVLVGALILGVFATSMSDYRIGRNMLMQERALAAAEYGQNDVLLNWNPAWSQLQAGDTVVRTHNVPGGGRDTVRVTRLNNTTFWLISSGSVGSAFQTQARRRTGLIVRLTAANLNVPAAVTSRLTTKFTESGSAYVNGNDGSPPGWSSCGPLSAPVAGLAVPDSTAQNYVNSSSIPNQGTPPVLETPVASADSTYTKFGGVTYTELTQKATIIYAAGANASNVQPAVSGGVCDKTKVGTSAPNWGEPERSPPWTGNPAVVPACYDYFPIIWAKGKFQFSGGRGQGIMLVDGDFVASGGAEFKGLVIVKGAMTTSGGGLKLQGALFTMGNTTTQNVMSGSTIIQFSSCALATVWQQALGLGSGAVPVVQRAWADMY